MAIGTAEFREQALSVFACRTAGEPPELLTSDEAPGYKQAEHDVYLAGADPERPPVCYAAVQKRRCRGRVVEVPRRLVCGTQAQLNRALERSAASRTINTAYVERYFATSRLRCAHKAREVYTFSKRKRMHRRVSWLCATDYNFCRPHGSLCRPRPARRATPRARR